MFKEEIPDQLLQLTSPILEKKKKQHGKKTNP